jgi:hypothetical protein
MRSSGVLLVLYALLMCVLSATSVGRVLLFVVAFGGATALVGGLQLVARRKEGLQVAFIGVAVLLTVGLVSLGMRAAFVVSNGGIEGPDGFGSPMAFLIGLAFEQGLFTLPSSGLMWSLWRTRRAAAAA